MRKIILRILMVSGVGIVFILIPNSWIPDLFTRLYVCVQFVVLLVMFDVLWKDEGWYAHANTAASIVTVIGVFGTFLGIFIGLQPFDTENIKDSIPPLIEGLKLAFLTSLVGIFSAIILKAFAFAYQMIKGKDPGEEAITQLFNSQTGELLKPLTALLKSQTEESQRIQNTLDSIKTSLSGDQSTALTQLQYLATRQDELIKSEKIGWDQSVKSLDSIKTSLMDGPDAISPQLQNLTNTLSENHTQVIDEFREFAEKVATVSTDKLVEALEEVVHKFNEKINEQFGENFKRLNEAVQEINVWQEQYRQQMEELAEEFRIAAQSVEQSREALGSAAESLITIGDRSESLVAIAEKLDPILHTLNGQLGAFSELGQQAREAFPRIEGSLNSLTDGFSSVLTIIEDRSESLVAITEKLNPILHTLNGQLEAFDELGQQAQEAFPRIEGGLNSLTDGFSSVLTIIEDRSESLVAITEKLNPILHTLNGQLEAFDELGQQAQEAFPRIEGSLNSLTDGFSSVLTIIEDRSESLVSITERLNPILHTLNGQLEAFDELGQQAHEAFPRIEESLNSLTDGFSSVLTIIEDRSESLVSIAGKLDPILHTLNGQLEAFDELGQQAREAFPRIEESLNSLTDGFSSAVEQTINNSHASVEKQREALTVHVDQLQVTVQNTSEQFNQITTTFSASVEKAINQSNTSLGEQREALANQLQHLQTAINTVLESVDQQLNEASASFSASVDASVRESQASVDQQREALTNLTQGLRGQLENVVTTTNKELDVTLRRSTQHIIGQVEKLDEELGKELRTALTMLGSQLTSLSEKFVEDYEPLTERLREIVTIAGNIPPQSPGGTP